MCVAKDYESGVSGTHTGV